MPRMPPCDSRITLKRQAGLAPDLWKANYDTFYRPGSGGNKAAENTKANKYQINICLRVSSKHKGDYSSRGQFCV